MDAPIKRGRGRPRKEVQPDISRGGPQHTRLSVFPSDEEGSRGGTDLQYQAGDVEAHSSMRDDAEGSTERRLSDDADAMYGGGLHNGDDGDGANSAGDSGYGISSLEALGRTQLPAVPDRYRVETGEATTETSGERVCRGVALQSGESPYDALGRISVEEQIELAARPWDGLTDTLARLKAQIIVARTRASEDLKQKQLDIMPKLLELVRQHEVLIPPQVLDLEPEEFPTSSDDLDQPHTP